VVALKVWQTLLQLHELRFAEGSPAGTAVKNDQGTPTVTGPVQVDALTVLVRQDDVREALPNCRANCGEVDTKVEGSSHKGSLREVSSLSPVPAPRRTSHGRSSLDSLRWVIPSGLFC
jgi:hypothetical protein